MSLSSRRSDGGDEDVQEREEVHLVPGGAQEHGSLDLCGSEVPEHPRSPASLCWS